MKSSTFLHASRVAVLAAILGVSSAGAAAQSAAPQLEGSWHFTVEVPPNPQNPNGLTFHGLSTYSRGGGFVQTDDNPATTPGSAGHGTWVRTGGDTFAQTFEKFTFNPILQQPGVFKVNESIVVDGGTYTGASTAFFCDINGENCIELGPADTSGRRIAVEN